MEEISSYKKSKFISDYKLFFEDEKLIDLHEDDPEFTFV